MKRLLLITAMLAGIVQAQPTQERMHPADPNAASTPLRFETGLMARKPPMDVDPPARWREHNDRVRTMGGHAGHLRAGAGEDAGPEGPAQAGNR